MLCNHQYRLSMCYRMADIKPQDPDSLFVTILMAPAVELLWFLQVVQRDLQQLLVMCTYCNSLLNEMQWKYLCKRIKVIQNSQKNLLNTILHINTF